MVIQVEQPFKACFYDTICQVSRDNEPLTRYKIISTTNQILLLHDGPILEFSLSHYLLESCPQIDHFTTFLSKNSVHKFSLEILEGDQHKLHSSFFSCRELRHMNLSKCTFTPPPAFEGFHRLVSLKFVDMVFSTNNFDKFISSCPQLESLTLIKPPPLFDCLAITAPNLKYLHFDRDFMLLRFGDVPFLQSLLFVSDFTSVNDEETCGLVEFFGCLPALKKLDVNDNLLLHFSVCGILKKLPTSISLQTLKLSEISFYCQVEVGSVFCLISSCPSIQRIEIEMYSEDDEDMVDQVLDFLKAQDYGPDIILDELREVHLTPVSGIEPELEFIKLLLAKSPALKTMLIKPYKDDDFSRLELLKILTRFQRASSMAEIIYEYGDTIDVR